MGKVRINDKTAQWIAKNTQAMDSALSRMADDLITVAKIRIPYKSNALQHSMRHDITGYLKHRVVVDKEYAAVQEIGRRMTGKGAPTRVFKNYTTPGTGAGYLSGAGQTIGRQTLNYIKQAIMLIRI